MTCSDSLLFYSGVEHGDEIYSLCQVPTPIVSKPIVQDKQSSPLQPIVKKSSTANVFKPKCLVDSATFLLPAGNGPVYLDVKKEPAKSKIIVSSEASLPLPIQLQATTSTANVIKKRQICSESPKATTAKIFAPRTEDMNKGFLTFSDDDTGLTSKLKEYSIVVFFFFFESRKLGSYVFH